jgi:hypothetical protein
VHLDPRAWCLQRDANPCFSLERAGTRSVVTWTYGVVATGGCHDALEWRLRKKAARPTGTAKLTSFPWGCRSVLHLVRLPACLQIEFRRSWIGHGQRIGPVGSPATPFIGLRAPARATSPSVAAQRATGPIRASPIASRRPWTPNISEDGNAWPPLGGRLLSDLYRARYDRATLASRLTICTGTECFIEAPRVTCPAGMHFS